MSMSPEHPRLDVEVNATSVVVRSADGRRDELHGDGDDVRRLVLTRAREEALAAGTAVELATSGDRGTHRLLVSEDGTVTTHDSAPAATRTELREQAWWLAGPPPATPSTTSSTDGEEPAPEEFAPEEPADEHSAPEDASSDDAASGFPDLADLAPEDPAQEDLAPEDASSDDAASGFPDLSDLAPDADSAPAKDDDPDILSLFTPEAETSEPAAAPSPDIPFTDAVPVQDAEDRPARPTFITAGSTQPVPRSGWRGLLARIGVTVRPSRAQLERDERAQVVSLQWAGCRTIAVANGKGGVGKTMTTAMLAAVYARHGGGNVLAWDNNDTRGTLGWRTEQGLYDTTIRDLLPEASRLLQADSSVSEIARYVHHQSADRYDVLRSNPELLATDQRITTADFDELMQVAARYYRMVIFDSGNDESADRWLRMIDSSYQLVVPTLAAPESAESAALLLDALRRRDDHSRRLAEQATVVIGQSERSSLAAVNEIADKFAGHVRAVEIIPFDHGLKSGPLRFDGLQRATQDAWVRAAASVARGL